jgi:hypothetical protein
MSVTVEWHATLPALIATFRGILTPANYRAMRAEQRALLEDCPDPVVLVVDVRQFEGFPTADTIKLDDTLLAHPQVIGVVIVLDTETYDRLARAILPADETRRVSFFKDFDAALAHAEARLHDA